MFGRVRRIMKRDSRADRRPVVSPEVSLQTGPALCILLLEDATLPANIAILPALQARLGNDVALTEGSPEEPVWFVDIGDVRGKIAFMPAAVPDEEAEDAAFGNFLWPDGREAAARHQAHLLVSLLEPPPDSLDAGLLLTRLALAASEAFGAIGMYWGGGSICNSAEMLKTLTQEMSRDHLPLNLWIRYQAVRNDDGSIGLYTVGLEPFGLMEIEVERSSWEPLRLVEFVFNVSHYLMVNGPVINNGDTVGEDEKERIHVSFERSLIEADKQVYRISIDEL